MSQSTGPDGYTTAAAVVSVIGRMYDAKYEVNLAALNAHFGSDGSEVVRVDELLRWIERNRTLIEPEMSREEFDDEMTVQPCTCRRPYNPRGMDPSSRSARPEMHEPGCTWRKQEERRAARRERGA